MSAYIAWVTNDEGYKIHVTDEYDTRAEAVEACWQGRPGADCVWSAEGPRGYVDVQWETALSHRIRLGLPEPRLADAATAPTTPRDPFDIEAARRRVCIKRALRRAGVEVPREREINENESALLALAAEHGVKPLTWEQVQRHGGICAIGLKDFPHAQAYCYTHEEAGLHDANVCPACLLAHVDQHFGPDAPSSRQIRQLYVSGIPSCQSAPLSR